MSQFTVLEKMSVGSVIRVLVCSCGVLAKDSFMDFGTLLFFAGISAAAFLAWLCVWVGEYK